MELVENVQSQPRQMYVAHAEAQSVSGTTVAAKCCQQSAKLAS
jgi:hypothetical protein